MELIPDGTKAKAVLFPSNPVREKWETFDRTDSFGLIAKR